MLYFAEASLHILHAKIGLKPMLSKNQIKNLTALHHKKHREESQLFFVEGIKVVDELIKSQYSVKEIYALPKWIESNQGLIGKNKIDVTEIDENDLKKISVLNTPNEVFAVVHSKQFTPDISSLTKDLSLYLDGVRDPGNFGTIVRLAHWFGIKQVICSLDCVETFNPKVVQSSMGSIFHVPVSCASINDVVDVSAGIRVFGAFLDGQNIYKTENFTSGLLVIGNESNGISPALVENITDRVFIPPASENHAESLNAAMATSIFLSEYLRRKKYF